MSKAELQLDLLQAALDALPDDGLAPVRETALRAFSERGLPGSRDEDWRYTNLADVAKLETDWLQALRDTGAADTSAGRYAELPDLDVHALLLCDGRVDEVSLQRVQSATADALEITRLADRADTVRTDGPLDALNATLLYDGLHIRLREGVSLDKPLAFFFIDGRQAASAARVVIDAGDGARADLVEYHLTGDDVEHFANTVIQLNARAGAHINLVRVQDRSASHVHTGKLAVRIARDATVSVAVFDLGSKLARHDLVADICEPGATVNMDGLYLADGRQHIDNHTRVDHRVGPAASNEEYRGILNGRARCVWNGKAIVHEGADGTDAQQANHNLLLSKRAEIDTKPELEIYAEDVKCSHGATVGQLDESALFYLRSRGLDREQARHALTRAFAAQILSRLPVEALREHLEARVDARLDELLQDTGSGDDE